MERKRRPLASVEVVKANPILEEVPNASCEAAMNKEMGDRFRRLFTKRAHPTIWPPSFRKAVGRPNPVLESKPSKEFDLRRGPKFPHKLLHV